ncbi:sensor histidine kinase [Pacificoceanicola onchidii]|uniref:sensor histidine kinase n=1 Tax=Pacificoceanicola onchidii TaxID=2562685 RepID=UPI0010A345C6|nr:ATP-binding protein [Pacificoceanicola onchidii]
MSKSRIGIWSNASLTLKFLAIAVPLTLVVTMTTFALIERERRSGAAQALDDRISKLAEIQGDAISGPVWNFNQTQIDLILEAIVNDPDLIGITVRDERGEPLGRIGLTSGDAVRAQTAQIFRVKDQPEPLLIGDIALHYTQGRLDSAAQQQVQNAILLTAFMALALTVSALVALQYAVRQPLVRFGKAIDAAQETSRYIPVEVTTGDEIGNLAGAYNTLQQKQKSDEAELRRIQDNLETLVEDRTEELKNAIDTLKAREREILRARDDARNALNSLQRTQDRLVQSEKMASLGQLTAGIAHEIKNPLNFVNNFSSLSEELLEELTDIVQACADKIEAEQAEDAIELVETVSGNLHKIQEHGRRADSIVRNMLLHSRSGPTTLQDANINAIVDEALKLSFHSARAEIDGFNIEMISELADGLPPVPCFPQDLSRVFINILSNGMYATHARRTSGEPDYAPVIHVSTRDTGTGTLEVIIEDNGPGMSKSVIEQIFTPFYTTKPAGEGTGLGLSISYDIVVTQHGGDIVVTSTPGSGARFVITLPLTGREDTPPGANKEPTS